jgi:hypothetical protein
LGQTLGLEEGLKGGKELVERENTSLRATHEALHKRPPEAGGRRVRYGAAAGHSRAASGRTRPASYVKKRMLLSSSTLSALQ